MMIKLDSYFGSPLFIHYRGLSEEFKGIVKKDQWQKSIVNPNGYVFKIVNSHGKTVDNLHIVDYKDSYEDILFEGAEFRLWIRGDGILAMTEQEFKKEVERKENERILKEKETEERQKKEYQERLEKSKTRKKQCNEFYKKLSIPVETTPVFMVVGSGLSESSAGNGTYKNSVVHLRINEELDDGKRFKRHPGDLLCNQKRTGRKTYWLQECNNETIDGEKYLEQVTCKSCLKILRNKKWLNESE